MKFISLFAGVGGFDLGLERAGMECVAQVEIDKHARAVLREHWPNVPKVEDVHDVVGIPTDERDLHSSAAAHLPTRESGERDRDTESTSRVSDQGVSDARVSHRHSECDSDHGPERDEPSGPRDRETNGPVPDPDGCIYPCGDRDPRGGEQSDVGSIGPVFLIAGGFPCQDYSVAGNREGLAGDRGALWWEFHRIVAECRPTWVVGENVPGLLSSAGGRDFRTIIGSLVQLGYGVSWTVLDSQYFGVPQRRRRLFIVGHLGGQPRPEILALSEGLFGHPAPSREAGERVAGGAQGRTRTYRYQDVNAPLVEDDVSATLRAESATRDERSVPAYVLDNHAQGNREPIAFQYKQSADFSAGIAPTLRAMNSLGGHGPSGNGHVAIAFHPRQDPIHGEACPPVETKGPHGVIPLLEVGARTGTSTDDPRAGCGIGEPGDPCFTLQASKQHGLLTPTPRRLTPLECERLQGFPDNWTRYGVTDDGERYEVSDKQRYKQMGNAVTVNVIEWIGRRIIKAHLRDLGEQ